MIHVPIKRENLDAKAHTHEECNMKTGVMLLETNELPEAQQENRLKEKKKNRKTGSHSPEHPQRSRDHADTFISDL
jgi:hypothetical protein